MSNKETSEKIAKSWQFQEVTDVPSSLPRSPWDVEEPILNFSQPPQKAINKKNKYLKPTSKQNEQKPVH